MSVTKPGCQELSSPPAQLSIQLPAGLQLQSMSVSGDTVISELANVQGLLAQLGPAMAALKPIFILVDTVIAIKDTITAIPGLIVGDIEPFTDALSRVTDGIAALGGTVPQVAVPLMVRDLIQTLVAALDIIDTVLDEIIDLGAQVDDLVALANGAPAAVKADMLAQAECLQKQADKLLEHTVASLGPIGGIMSMAQSLMDMVPGLPGLPSLEDMTGQSVEQVKTAVAELKAALQLLPI